MTNFKDFLIFISIVLSIYIIINSYIYVRSMQAFSLSGITKFVFSTMLIFLMVSFPLAQLVSKIFGNCNIEKYFVIIGSYWIFFMFYVFLFILFIDIIRIINHFANFIPSIISDNILVSKRVIGFIIIIFTTSILLYGYKKANDVEINKFVFDIEKYSNDKKPLSIIHLTDLHLGYFIGEKHINKIKSVVDEINPDLVLYSGDIVDRDTDCIYDLIENLSQIKGKKGTFAVLGNHEYYGNLNKSIEFIDNSGIKLLNNEVYIFDGLVNILGLDDPTGNDRKAPYENILDDTIKNIDKNLPIIMLHHQPIKLEETAKRKIDLLLCGHTHGGQIFPFGLLVKLRYELISGYKKVINMHTYVSNGVGTWGPVIRVGANPEITHIIIK